MNAPQLRVDDFSSRSAAREALLDVGVLPATEDIEDMDALRKVRAAYARRITHQIESLAPNGRAYVEVRYHQATDIPWYEKLCAAHEQARRAMHDGEPKKGLLVIEHRPHGEASRFYGVCLLTTILKAPPRLSIVNFLRRYGIRQEFTRQDPDPRWGIVERKARSLRERTPILVRAIYGTRSGTALAPLTYFLRGDDDPTPTEHQARHTHPWEPDTA